MPVVDFDQSNKVQTTNFDYPKLKLKNGQRARILLLESPTVEYVHTLRAPQIVNGIPQMGTEKRKDGTEYQDYKKDFVSRPLCLGDFNVLQAKGSDPERCQMCRMAQEHPDWVQAPQRRYAMHVINYKIKAGGFDLVTPFSVEVVVWSFTDTIFNQIIDFKTEWGDLRQHDLLLGPCTNETFQKFEINVGAKAGWLEDEARKALTVETYKNNQIPDLAIACGSRKESRWVDLDLEKIREGWNVIAASGTTPGQVASTSSASLTDSLSDLLDTPPATTAPAGVVPTQAASSDAAADLDDLLASSVGETPAAEAPAVEAPAASAPAAESTPAAGATDFDDLLAGL